ncbi:MAG TPA: hypothetical protein V6D47_09235 [Oscillatoriaceae cyanobacterium]
MPELYTLETLSERLGGVPLSTLKHRITQLGIPAAARGSRNKLLFDERAAKMIEASDQLLKQGNGISSTRRLLGLEEAETARIEIATTEPVPTPTLAPAADSDALDRLARALEQALAQLESKDAQIAQLNEELRRATEASATFQQKTFYLQSELQRLQGELKEAFKLSKERPWERLFKRGALPREDA